MEMNLEKQQRGQMVASLTGHSKDFAFYFGWQWEAIRGFWKREEILCFKNNHFGYSADNMVGDKERIDQLGDYGRLQKNGPKFFPVPVCTFPYKVPLLLLS